MKPPNLEVPAGVRFASSVSAEDEQQGETSAKASPMSPCTPAFEGRSAASVALIKSNRAQAKMGQQYDQTNDLLAELEAQLQESKNMFSRFAPKIELADAKDPYALDSSEDDDDDEQCPTPKLSPAPAPTAPPAQPPSKRASCEPPRAPVAVLEQKQFMFFDASDSSASSSRASSRADARISLSGGGGAAAALSSGFATRPVATPARGARARRASVDCGTMDVLGQLTANGNAGMRPPSSMAQAAMHAPCPPSQAAPSAASGGGFRPRPPSAFSSAMQNMQQQAPPAAAAASNNAYQPPGSAAAQRQRRLSDLGGVAPPAFMQLQQQAYGEMDPSLSFTRVLPEGFDPRPGHGLAPRSRRGSATGDVGTGGGDGGSAGLSPGLLGGQQRGSTPSRGQRLSTPGSSFTTATATPYGLSFTSSPTSASVPPAAAAASLSSPALGALGGCIGGDAATPADRLPQLRTPRTSTTGMACGSATSPTGAFASTGVSPSKAGTTMNSAAAAAPSGSVSVAAAAAVVAGSAAGGVSGARAAGGPAGSRVGSQRGRRASIASYSTPMTPYSAIGSPLAPSPHGFSHAPMTNQNLQQQQQQQHLHGYAALAGGSPGSGHSSGPNSTSCGSFLMTGGVGVLSGSVGCPAPPRTATPERPRVPRHLANPDNSPIFRKVSAT